MLHINGNAGVTIPGFDSLISLFSSQSAGMEHALRMFSCSCHGEIPQEESTHERPCDSHPGSGLRAINGLHLSSHSCNLGTNGHERQLRSSSDWCPVCHQQP